MRVALINPPVPSGASWVREGRCMQIDIWGAPFPPLTLARLAGMVISEGGEARIFDAAVAGCSAENLAGQVVSFAPGLVVLATTTPTLRHDGGWFAPMLAGRLPGVPIAALGIHVSALAERTLADFPAIDYAIVGEPDCTSVELAAAIAAGSEPDGIRGLVFRRADSVISTGRREPDSDLDSLPLPAWPGVSRERYRMPILGGPFNLIETVRGCPHGCTFCPSHHLSGRRLRRRSVARVVEEMLSDLEQGIGDFLFWAESFTLDRDYVMALIAEMDRRGLGGRVRWVCNSRVDALDDELLGAIRRAGCWQIALGMEFGTDQLLQKVGKGRSVTVALAEEAGRRAVAAGMVVDGHFILGHPGESVETMRATVDLALRAPLTFAHFYCATPFPGSDLYEQASRSGWLRDEDLYSMSQSNYVMQVDGLTPETVHREVRRAYRKFYGRFVTLRRVLAIPATPRQWLSLFALGGRFIRRLLSEA